MTCERCKKKLRPGDRVVPIHTVTETGKYAGQTVNDFPDWMHLSCPTPRT